MMRISRRTAGLTLFVTMALAGAACDAGTTDGTMPGQEIPADDGLGGEGGEGIGGGDTGAGDDLGGTTDEGLDG